MVEHRYGGPWTDIKLDAVEYYLQCYTKALSNRAFDLWYIDGFAGTGDRTVELPSGGLFDSSSEVGKVETLAGSARRALAVRPPFHHFVFIEENKRRFAALSSLKREHPGRDIRFAQADANNYLRQLIQEDPWRKKDTGLGRAVVFLDPYSLQVEWATLEALARTRVMDVWYLFPFRDVVRQLAHRLSGIGPKEPTLDRVLGKDWRQLYAAHASRTEPDPDLFSHRNDDPKREATSREIEQWFRERLRSIFPYVSEPLPLLASRQRQLFSLFLGVSNPSGPAINLAKHFASYVIQRHGPRASHRTSRP